MYLIINWDHSAIIIKDCGCIFMDNESERKIAKIVGFDGFFVEQ